MLPPTRRRKMKHGSTPAVGDVDHPRQLVLPAVERPLLVVPEVRHLAALRVLAAPAHDVHLPRKLVEAAEPGADGTVLGVPRLSGAPGDLTPPPAPRARFAASSSSSSRTSPACSASLRPGTAAAGGACGETISAAGAAAAATAAAATATAAAADPLWVGLEGGGRGPPPSVLPLWWGLRLCGGKAPADGREG